jgi:alginate O-acetyltransferase complex protein AlgJ
VFLRTDTHWTPEGAEIAANTLAKTIADKFPLSGEPQRFVTEPAEKVTHKGDLRLFLPLDPLFENLMPAQEPLQNATPWRPATSRPVTTRCSPTAKCRWH